MFVVLGATGHTGSVVAETLSARKQSVRVVVRSADKGASWKSKGAEIAVASLDDVPALTNAFRGASGVYLLVPPNYGASAWLAEQRQRMDQAAEVVKASGISHVVFFSSVGGQIPEDTGPIRAVRSLWRTEAGSRGTAPNDLAPLLLHGELGSRDRHGQRGRCPADVHCIGGQDSDGLNKGHLAGGSGMFDLGR